MSIPTCTFSYGDRICGEVAVAKGCCSRHYAQKRRKRLGSTKEIEHGTTKPNISVCLTPETLDLLDKRAGKLHRSRSETLEAIALGKLPPLT